MKPLPPGPKPLPLIGNIHQHPGTEQWKTYQQWHGKYGPLIYTKLAGFNVIIIGSHKVAHDLLEKRGRIYSSRPRMIYLYECMTKRLQPSFMPYGDLWKTINRLETPLLNTKAVKAYRPIHDLLSKQLLYELLSAKNLSNHLTRYSCGVLFTLALGRTLPPGEESDLFDVVRFVEKKVTEYHWAHFLVDVFPFLNYLPDWLASWKRSGNAMYNEEIQLMSRTIDSALKTGNWCWAAELSAQIRKEDLPWEQLCYLVSELLLTGFVSTKAMLNLFVEMCSIYPGCMKKMQEELDLVVGTERLPSVDDKPNLPYFHAFMNEILRWRPIAPLGMLHSVSEDDEYMGFRIPKDSVIVTNHFCVDRDMSIHSDPDEFRPERWLEEPNLPLSAFGFGRRRCPGSVFAEHTLFMALSRLIWAYDIEPTDMLYRENKIKRMTQKGHAVAAVPPPSKASFKSRSARHRETVMRECMGAEKDILGHLAEVGFKV